MPHPSSPPFVELSGGNASLVLGKPETISSLLAPLPLVLWQEFGSDIWATEVWSLVLKTGLWPEQGSVHIFASEEKKGPRSYVYLTGQRELTASGLSAHQPASAGAAGRALAGGMAGILSPGKV